jgi:hypothetical protein
MAPWLNRCSKTPSSNTLNVLVKSSVLMRIRHAISEQIVGGKRTSAVAWKTSAKWPIDKVIPSPM